MSRQAEQCSLYSVRLVDASRYRLLSQVGLVREGRVCWSQYESEVVYPAGNRRGNGCGPVYALGGLGRLANRLGETTWRRRGERDEWRKAMLEGINTLVTSGLAYHRGSVRSTVLALKLA